MVSFRSSEPQPEFTGLAVPIYITFRAATATKSVQLCAYCDVPERVISLLQRMIQQAGGMSVCQSIETDGFCQHLLIGAQLPGLSSSDLWQMRAAIQKAGGIVETVRVNYQIRRPESSSPQPKACRGCCYYYGKRNGNAQLICAMHPYGPSDDICQDWEAQVTDY
jgi:hypothetical protein